MELVGSLEGVDMVFDRLAMEELEIAHERSGELLAVAATTRGSRTTTGSTTRGRRTSPGA